MHTVEMAAITDDPDLLALAPEPSRPLTARRTALLVAGGGALGAVLRWLLELAVPVTLAPTLVEVPWATWTANILGCLILGIAVGVLEVRRDVSAWVHPFVATGVCGGFTTMSTLVLQVSAMIGAQFPLVALEYGIGTVLFAIGALAIGLAAGRLLGRRPA